MSQFQQFSAAVAARFEQMVSHGEIYRLNVSPDLLWDVYLKAFPAGTNEVFRERTEHDGSYDRNFIKRVGNMVSIDPVTGKRVNLWSDHSDLPFPYNVVAEELASYVEAGDIEAIFRTKETTAGHKPNFEEINGVQHQWFHFFVQLPRFVISNDAGAAIGQIGTNVSVMKRGLEEIEPTALQQVIDLIDAKALYRGEESLSNLQTFQRAQNMYLRQDSIVRNTLLWLNCKNNVLMLRNTAIGSLLVDLSEGMGLEDAVKSFEQKVAPQNYKRTTALITPAMVTNAMGKVSELGLENSLYRRHARLSDLNIEDVLWADASAKNIMAGTITDILMQSAIKKAPKADTAEEIGIEDFMSSVLPKATNMELYVANKLQSHFVNITAPRFDDSTPLFKWDNGFGWSYKGNVTDSIKERVKAAGGNIKADFRVSLAWHNSDDLDLHCLPPRSSEIYFGHKQGILDVDMNAGGNVNTVDPVENMAFMAPHDGKYRFWVDPFSRRSDNQTKPGFTLQVECAGELHELTYPKAVNRNISDALVVTLKDGKIEDMQSNKDMIHAAQSVKTNGISTESFVRVSTVMLSPNHWGNKQVGNKHFIFLLEGAKTDEFVRGIYNEFLRPELEEHRKVFEVLGSKTVVAPEDEQLAGLGFSSTVRSEALIKVSGPSINKTYMVKF